MRRDKDASEGTSNCLAKKKNKKQWCEGSLVAVADHRGGRKPAEGTPNHFEKLLEWPCPNHAFHVKHLYKDCALMKRFLSEASNKGEHGKDPDPTMDDAEGKDDDFPTPNSCLMIFGGSTAYDSKHHQKVVRCEVYTAQPATPPFLQWLESAITFDRTDNPDTIPHPGRYPLIVDPIVGIK